MGIGMTVFVMMVTIFMLFILLFTAGVRHCHFFSTGSNDTTFRIDFGKHFQNKIIQSQSIADHSDIFRCNLRRSAGVSM